MTDIAIKVESLTKTYKLYDAPIDRLKESLHWRGKKYHKDFHALNNVSFDIKKGETVGIIGKNGSGKSTLLKIITGVLTPTSGNVTVNGRVSALLELGAGFNPEYTGLENIYFQGAIMGYERHEMDARIDEILTFADIGDFIYQPVKTYSSGMFARLAFAVAINVEPDILIVDEALSVGDAAFQQKCMRFMRKFKDNGGMLIFVSHDTAAVSSLCQKVIWLNMGINQYCGNSKNGTELYLKYVYSQNDEILIENSESLNSDEIIIENKIDNDSYDCLFTDTRSEIINKYNLSGDIRIFHFNDSVENFGLKKAEVVGVEFLDANKRRLNHINGGHKVFLKIIAKSYDDLNNIIIGFQIKDRLGQFLFGDNTFLSYMNSGFNVSNGEEFYAEFYFFMPILPKGHYSVCIGLAEGTQESHVQHHFLHDALIFESTNSGLVFGLVGIPMLDIKLKKDHI